MELPLSVKMLVIADGSDLGEFRDRRHEVAVAGVALGCRLV